MKVSSVLSQKNLLKGVLLIASLVTLWLLHPQVSVFIAWVGDRQAVTGTMYRLGVWGPLALFILLVLQVFVAIIPGHALIMTGGYVYGFTTCLLITMASTVLGSQIAFAIARRYGRRLIYRMAHPETIEKWDSLAANQGAMFYFFTFVLPLFPSDLMCYVAGLGTIPARRFFLANVFGRFVCATLMTLVGAYGMQMPAIYWVAGILVMVGIYAAWIIYSRRSKITIGSRKTLDGAKNENRHSIPVLSADGQRGCALC